MAGRGTQLRTVLALIALQILTAGAAPAEGVVIAGRSTGQRLLIAEAGQVHAKIVVAPATGPEERKGAEDLAHYIGLMTGAAPAIVSREAAIEEALIRGGPLIIVGEMALALAPELRERLARVVKPAPTLRTDGIVLRRDGARVYVAGNNDLAHAFAAAELLRLWGVRWFMPGVFGEAVPEGTGLAVGELDIAQSSPFELRWYNVTWLGDRTGEAEFKRRNLMAWSPGFPPVGHTLGKYTRDLPGGGGRSQSFSMSAPATAEHIARKIAGDFAAGKHVSLGIEDAIYGESHPADGHLTRLRWDKYMMTWSMTDRLMELYNNVARILQKRYPASASRIGFLAYTNATLPPVRDIRAEPQLFAQLAPIDIDPIHGMDDPRSPPRQEYREMLYSWTRVMGGRVAIYDYDQGMLVWRDLPNPSHMAFKQDVQHYRKAGILGFVTESRMALATTFINLYLRSRLMWNPNEDVGALIEDFYPRFYGPAAAAMRSYWGRIFAAWERTIVTEHEYFIIPAIYTPELVTELAGHLAEAERQLASATVGWRISRNQLLYLERLRFTQLSFALIRAYTEMVAAAATEVDYPKAVAAGERGLAVREALTRMNPAFTSTRLEKGDAWWTGEVQQYRELIAFTNGAKGTLVRRLPLKWAFRRDPDRTGRAEGLAAEPIDWAFWREKGAAFDVESLKDYPANEWQMLRTDLYAQAQGVRMPDQQSYTGDLWYRTDVDLAPGEAGVGLRIRFPGLFNPCRLYVNGELVGVREQKTLWWLDDYRFEWDVGPGLAWKPGRNTITLQCTCEHHFAGMFRRPFLYRVTDR
jgi:hypothetical protein